MQIVCDQVEVHVPPTIRLPGPVAMCLSNPETVRVRAIAGPSRLSGYDGFAGVAEEHLSVKAIHSVLERVGAPLVGVELVRENGIPASTLGTRTAAIGIGVAAGQALLGGEEAVDLAADSDLATHLGADSLRWAALISGGATVLGESPLPVGNPEWSVTVFVPAFSIPPWERKEPQTDRSVVLALACAGNQAAAEQLLWATRTEDLSRLKRQLPSSVAMMEWLRERSYPAFIPECGPSVATLGEVSTVHLAAAAKSGWKPYRFRGSDRGLQVSEAGDRLPQV